MWFAIDVSGLDKALKAANTLAGSIRPQAINLWATTVETTARRLCNDTANDIELKHTANKQLKFGYKDEKSKECLIRAIETHVDSMPPLLAGIFKNLVEEIKSGKYNQ